MTEDEIFQALFDRVKELCYEAHNSLGNTQIDVLRMALAYEPFASHPYGALSEEGERIGQSIAVQLKRARKEFPSRAAEVKEYVMQGLEVELPPYLRKA